MSFFLLDLGSIGYSGYLGYLVCMFDLRIEALLVVWFEFSGNQSYL
jgi:hypothetical protein